MAGLRFPCRRRLGRSPLLATLGAAPPASDPWLPVVAPGVLAAAAAVAWWVCWRALRRVRAEQARVRDHLRRLPRIVHDLNNALVGVLGNAELLLARRDLDARARAGAAEMHDACERARRLCLELSAGIHELTVPAGGAASASTALVIAGGTDASRRTVRALVGLGFEVATAAPREALAILRQRPPDLVLLDASGSDRPGAGLLPDLRRSDRTVRVVLVARPDADAPPAGEADAVLYEPFSPAELAAAVARAMRAG